MKVRLPCHRSLLLAILLSGGIALAPAATLVLSNRETPGAPSTALLVDSRGQRLPVGAWIQAGTFPGRSPAEITDLCAGGASAVLAALVPFGDSSSVGTGAAGSAGTIEFAASAPLATGLTEIYGVLLNAAPAEDASEMLVVKLANEVPADDACGLEGYLAVHLRDAEPVFGATVSGGLATATWLTGFAAWIASRLPSGSAAANRIADADPDGDGLANLVEYALGSDAGDRNSCSGAALILTGDAPVIRSLRRNDDAQLEYAVETSDSLAPESWIPVTSSPAAVTGPPDAPLGYHWIDQILPATIRSGLFVRLRITQAAAN